MLISTYIGFSLGFIAGIVLVFVWDEKKRSDEHDAQIRAMKAAEDARSRYIDWVMKEYGC